MSYVDKTALNIFNFKMNDGGKIYEKFMNNLTQKHIKVFRPTELESYNQVQLARDLLMQTLPYQMYNWTVTAN